MKTTVNIKKQAGFNLIEVLLAFLILSIGLLGVAGLQTTAVKASHTAMLRTIAITKIQEIIARRRSNMMAPLTDYAQDRGAADSLGTDNKCDGAAPVVCTAAQLAKNDLFSWGNSLVNAGLPATGTEASVLVNVAFTPPVGTVTVYWKERGKEMSYETSIQ